MIIIALTILCSKLEDAYRYDASLSSVLSFKVGNIECQGHFNQDGEFIPIVSIIPRADEWDITSNAPRPLESVFREKERLYELRHGVLIPVFYYRERGFVPEVGGEIVPFSEYKYTPLSRRIYNLPGRFIPKGQPDLYPNRNPK